MVVDIPGSSGLQVITIFSYFTVQKGLILVNFQTISGQFFQRILQNTLKKIKIDFVCFVFVNPKFKVLKLIFVQLNQRVKDEH